MPRVRIVLSAATWTLPYWVALKVFSRGPEEEGLVSFPHRTGQRCVHRSNLHFFRRRGSPALRPRPLAFHFILITAVDRTSHAASFSEVNTCGKSLVTQMGVCGAVDVTAHQSPNSRFTLSNRPFLGSYVGAVSAAPPPEPRMPSRFAHLDYEARQMVAVILLQCLNGEELTASRLTITVLFLPLLSPAADTHWTRLKSPNFEMYSSGGANAEPSIRSVSSSRYADSSCKYSMVPPAKPAPVRLVAFGSPKEFEPYRRLSLPSPTITMRSTATTS